MYNPDRKPDLSPAPWRQPQAGVTPAGSYEIPYAEAAPAPGPSAHLNYLTLLWRRKYWVLAAALVGLAAGVAYVVFTPPIYRASAMLEVVGFNESFMGMNQFDPQAGTGSYSATAANIQTQIRILQSANLINRAVERVNLELTPMLPASSSIFGKARAMLQVVPQEPVEFMRQAVYMASRNVSARGVGASRLIEVSCQSTAPDIAASFINALATEYVTQNSQFRSSSATRTAQWLESQLEEARNKLEQADARLQDFIRKEGIAFVLDQNTLADSKLRQLQADLSALQADRITKQSKYELAKSSPIDSLPEILDDGTLRGLRDRLTELRRERAQLTATLTPEHYRVKRIDAQIQEVEQTMQREKANLVKRIQNDYEAALTREKLMANAYATQSRAVVGQADKAGQYGLLKREVEMARQVYNLLLQQYNQSAVVAAVPTNTVRVVETAMPVSQPSKPSPLRDIPLSAGLGAALGYGAVLLVEMIRLRRLSRVFVAPGHAGTALNVPELGVIPALTRGTRRRLVWTSAPSSNGSGDAGGGAELVNWTEKPSFLAESFRYVLTSLLAQQREKWRVVLVVTSAGAGDGKSTLASNLAIATAETGRKVLIVDGDLRKGRLHKRFGLEEDKGLAELIADNTPVDQIGLVDYIRPTGVPGLSLLSCGVELPEQVGAALFSQRIPVLFARLRAEYDVVLVDTPPVLSLPDARLLGRVTDGAILVVRSGVTLREDAMAAAQRILSDGIPILGTILNDWDPSNASQYDYYGGRYGGYSAYKGYER
jgi:succinoglycan biosynthesis transport protein ExoP